LWTALYRCSALFVGASLVVCFASASEMQPRRREQLTNERTDLAIGMQAMRLQAALAGAHVGQLKKPPESGPTAKDNLNASILQSGADAERVRMNTAEHDWIVKRRMPKFLPDDEHLKEPTNSLRWQERKTDHAERLKSSCP
jgi:hypothetical protein